VDGQGSKGGMLLGWEGLGKQVAEVYGTGDVGDKELVLLTAERGTGSNRIACQCSSIFWPGPFQKPNHTHTHCHIR
jgi:hypothetical protein